MFVLNIANLLIIYTLNSSAGTVTASMLLFYIYSLDTSLTFLSLLVIKVLSLFRFNRHTGRYTLRPTRQPRRSLMECWSQTLPRCIWCRLGWQVMIAPSPPPFCLSFLSACLTVCQSAWAVFLTDGFYL